MRIIARNTLTRFVQKLAGHKDQQAVKAALDAWFYEVKQATWENPAEVKQRYANASIVGAGRAVFNIEGHDYRLVTAMDYRRGIVFIKWIGAHKDYDKIDARTVQYGDQAHQD